MIGEKDSLGLRMGDDRNTRYWKSQNRKNSLEQEICYQERDVRSGYPGFDEIQLSAYGFDFSICRLA